ncbi:hypothetical protein [Emticicia sp.]|uniref:hypothetical protein n=1 Tax=Emticicia sp. TaxID=1930953 RepID=UPI0037514DBF
MKNTIKFLQIGLISGLLFLAACTGEKGTVGPQGTAGAVGAAGEKGSAGAAGDFTKVLTGNVIIKGATWTAQTIDVADDGYYVIIPEKQITKAILDKGIVMVYYTFSGISTPMPYLFGAGKFLHLAYLEKGEGRIRIDLQPAIYLSKLIKPSTDYSFRWVIATGSTGGRMSNINWNDYNDVKTKLGLKD